MFIVITKEVRIRKWKKRKKEGNNVTSIGGHIINYVHRNHP